MAAIRHPRGPRSRTPMWLAAASVVALLVTVPLWSSPTGAVGSPFVDVPAGAYYEAAAQWLSDAGITGGYPDATHFSPDVLVTRAMMAAFLWRMDGRPAAPSGGFVDVPAGSWYDVPSGWLLQLGVTTGLGGDLARFGPSGTVTRAQMAAFLWRLAGRPDAPVAAFTDVPAGAWYEMAARWLLRMHITTGYGGDPTRFAPDVGVSRAQMAAFLYRYDAADPDVAQYDVWVATASGSVVVLDPVTWEVSRSIDLGVAQLRSIAVVGHELWYAHGDAWGTVGRYDLITGTNAPDLINPVYSGLLRSSPAVPGTLFIGFQGLSAATLQRWDVGGPTPAKVAEQSDPGAWLADVEISPDGAVVWVASSIPSAVVELHAADLTPTGRTFGVAGTFPLSVDATVDGGTPVLAIGTQSVDVTADDVFVYPTAQPGLGLSWDEGETDLDGFLVLSPDGTRTYSALVPAPHVSRDGAVSTSPVLGDTSLLVDVVASQRFEGGVDVDPRTGRVVVATDDSVTVLTEMGEPYDQVGPFSDPSQVLVVPR